MKAAAWYIKYPADAYALGPIHFDHPAKEEEVRKSARDFDGCKRLPRGFTCWPAKEEKR